MQAAEEGASAAAARQSVVTVVPAQVMVTFAAATYAVSMVASATAYAVAPSLHRMSQVEFLRQIHNHDPRSGSPCTCPLSS